MSEKCYLQFIYDLDDNDSFLFLKPKLSKNRGRKYIFPSKNIYTTSQTKLLSWQNIFCWCRNLQLTLVPGVALEGFIRMKKVFISYTKKLLQNRTYITDAQNAQKPILLRLFKSVIPKTINEKFIFFVNVICINHEKGCLLENKATSLKQIKSKFVYKWYLGLTKTGPQTLMKKLLL